LYHSEYYFRSFARCKSCYWNATILAKVESFECPLCPGKEVELMPLNLNEKYEYSIEANKGLEIKFSRF
jgi:hypothetical protein